MLLGEVHSIHVGRVVLNKEDCCRYRLNLTVASANPTVFRALYLMHVDVNGGRPANCRNNFQ